KLPAWLHLGAPPNTYHKIKDKCMHLKHKIKSIRDLAELTTRLGRRRIHYAHAACTCNDCSTDQQAKCKNPHKCAKTAKTIIDKLLPKFNPNTSPKKDDLTLTHRRKEKNSHTLQWRQGDVIFDPTVT
ncbi:hypothetical protein BDR04DRAFT_946412, partial [Suillus decipiens]